MLRAILKILAGVLGWLALYHLFTFVVRQFDPYGLYRSLTPEILCLYGCVLLLIRDRVIRVFGIACAVVSVGLFLFGARGHPLAQIRYAKTRELLQSLQIGCELYEHDLRLPAPWGASNFLTTLEGETPARYTYTPYLGLPERNRGAAGAILDAWGSPLWFGTSATSRIVFSAGMDQAFGTRDDIVLRFSHFANHAVERTAK